MSHRRTRQDNIKNLILAILNIAILVIAAFLLEFETAKARRPDIGWPDTPSGVIYAVAGAMALASLIVLGILTLIYKKELHNRPYLWWITGFDVIIGIGLLFFIARQTGLWTLIHFVLFP